MAKVDTVNDVQLESFASYISRDLFLGACSPANEYNFELVFREVLSFMAYQIAEI